MILDFTSSIVIQDPSCSGEKEGIPITFFKSKKELLPEINNIGIVVHIQAVKVFFYFIFFFE